MDTLDKVWVEMDIQENFLHEQSGQERQFLDELIVDPYFHSLEECINSND